MNRIFAALRMLWEAVKRLRRGKAPFTNREMVAGFSQMERDRFPELDRFPDAIAADKAWQQAADDTKGLFWTFGLVVIALIVVWRFLRVPLLAWISHQIVLGWFAQLCLDVLMGAVVGILAILIAMRLHHRSVRRSLRRQLNNDVSEPTCMACGYNLTGNRSGTCPECGYSTSRG